jgi:hypothetical protein
VGAFSVLAQFLSPWRQPPLAAVVPAQDGSGIGGNTEGAPAARQISLQLGDALLTKHLPELAARRAEIVDTFKRQCPNFAVMRKVVLSFRSILRAESSRRCICGRSGRAEDGIYAQAKPIRLEVQQFFQPHQ